MLSYHLKGPEAWLSSTADSSIYLDFFLKSAEGKLGYVHNHGNDPMYALTISEHERSHQLKFYNLP